MAVSLKLAGAFSLSLSWMLVAVLVCRAEEKDWSCSAAPYTNQRDAFPCESQSLSFGLFHCGGSIKMTVRKSHVCTCEGYYADTFRKMCKIHTFVLKQEQQ